jgi:hypothetical protein
MKKPVRTEDPTIEEKIPDFDGAHTDQPSDAYRVDVVSTSENGGIDHDARGQARWRWNAEAGSGQATDQTFDELEALTNAGLTLEDAAAEPALPGQAYDPYATTPRRTKRK